MRNTIFKTEEEYRLQLKNGRLIADFMECQKVDLGDGRWDEYRIPENAYDETDNSVDTFNIHNLEYHQSWDWLMPVVDKIESLDANEEKYILESAGNEAEFILYGNGFPNGHFVRQYDFDENDEDNKLTAIYNAVVRFIHWYNEEYENG